MLPVLSPSGGNVIFLAQWNFYHHGMHHFGIKTKNIDAALAADGYVHRKTISMLLKNGRRQEELERLLKKIYFTCEDDYNIVVHDIIDTRNNGMSPSYYSRFRDRNWSLTPRRYNAYTGAGSLYTISVGTGSVDTVPGGSASGTNDYSCNWITIPRMRYSSTHTFL